MLVIFSRLVADVNDVNIYNVENFNVHTFLEVMGIKVMV